MVSQALLKKKILSDRYNALVFQTGKDHDIFLVGGYIRDLLRGFRAQDRDFTVGNDFDAFLAKMNIKIPGTIITFKKGKVARFVVKKGTFFDFTPLHGTLKHDLSQRDFSINALAWSPEKGVIDLHDGIQDIGQRIVRAISKQNILSDPLRILRAYRFAAEMNGTIEKTTRNIIKSAHYKIKDASPERITLELFQLLNQNNSAKYLKNALDDMVLTDIFPYKSKCLKNNIQSVSDFERRTKKDSYRIFKASLKKTYSQVLIYKGLLCLELMLLPFNTKSVEQSCLRMSRKILKRLTCFSKGLEYLEQKRTSDKEQLFHLFYHTKEASPDVLLAKSMTADLKHYRHYISLWKGRSIKTDLIKNMLDVESGMVLGKIIREVRKAEFLDEIRSEEQARKYIKQNYPELARSK
ncbi:MAG: hypothetical protein RDU01_01445 [Thermodesulfovibrionales bacterium]|nr:hypothetical protein [Thermodesulfovibrionales bacterium]